MKLNSRMGYVPVTFSELTEDEEFWRGCQAVSYTHLIAGQGRKLPVGVDQRLVHECLSLLREVRAHERAEIFIP